MTHGQARAVFLAAIMVLSMVAMGAVFAGGAAADETQTLVVGDDAEYDTIQGAIDDAHPGDTIAVRDGTYDPFDRVETNELTITAEEGSSPVIRASADDFSASSRIVDINAEEVEFSDIRVEGPERGVGVGVRLGNDKSTDGSVVSGVTVSNVLTGIQTGETATNANIVDNDVSNAVVGISLQADGSTVLRNTISGIETAGEYPAEGIGVVKSDHTLEENTISSDSSAVDIRFYNDEVPTVNDDDSGNEISVANTVLAESGVDSVEFYDSSHLYDGSVTINNTAYATVQQATDSAESGAVVEVEAGVYPGPIEINTADVAIRGTDEQLPVIEGGVIVDADGVAIDRLEIEGTDRPAVRVSQDTMAFSLTDSHLRKGAGDNRHALLFEGGQAGHLVDSNTFENQQDASGNPILAYVNGDTSVGTSSTGVDFVNNTFVGEDLGDGLALGHEADDSEVSHNTFAVSSEFGQVELFGENAVVRDNRFVTEELDSGAFYIRDAGQTLEQSVLWNNEFAGGTIVDNAQNEPVTVFSTIDDSLTSIEKHGVVFASSGSFTEDVTVSTRNITLIGVGDETVINGLVQIDAEQSSLVNVAVKPDPFHRPDGDRIPPTERQAILITASDAGVYDSTVDVSLDANGDFEEVNAIQVFGGEPITGVQIVDNDITGTATGYDVAGVVGVSDQAETTETVVYNNSIDVDSEGYSFGVVTRASGGDNVDETPESIVMYNDIDATADAYPGVGYGIESTEEAQVNADSQIVKDNTFGDVDSIQHKADNGALDITMNEWEDVDNVSFLTESFDSSVEDGGELVYDPFLTSTPDPNDFTPPSERTAFGHDLVVPADGGVHSVAFPAPVEGTVSEVFDDFDGTVYAYDGDDWVTGETIADEEIGALDAFAVSVDESGDDLRITFEYADGDSDIPSMTTADLDTGWNFVGAPNGGEASEAFAPATADVTTVVDALGGPDPQTMPYGLTGSGQVANPSTVSPFQGYWVFVTDDGKLGATVPVDPTQETEEGALTGN
ncbi:surface glycoprotein [Halorubrum sp. DTA46]|uniref:surface glycoprotein n=1 Tax=Halorubrum sp. DTA46 TaxID=3402162 RepID=UPI003AAD6016